MAPSGWTFAVSIVNPVDRFNCLLNMSIAAARTSTALFAWQGWQLTLPARWNPVKLEGDERSGYALIAGMDRPQLGLRWKKTPAKRFDAMRALRGEVGSIAAAKGKPYSMALRSWGDSLLFLEADPPGRDVFVAHSAVSGR